MRALVFALGNRAPFTGRGSAARRYGLYVAGHPRRPQAVAALLLLGLPLAGCDDRSPAEPAPELDAKAAWAFEETFTGNPVTPSQRLLLRTFEYVATHRSHPRDHFTKRYSPFPVDHGENCAGPDPALAPVP